MISEHELTVKVRELYPKIQEIEKECLNLFNQHFRSGRGPTGVRGNNEYAYSIEYLRSAANMLQRLGKEKGLIEK